MRLKGFQGSCDYDDKSQMTIITKVQLKFHIELSPSKPWLRIWKRCQLIEVFF